MKSGLENYELRDRLGEDSVGETWTAMRGRPERLVRLRILKHELLTRDDLRPGILAEVRLAASIRHASLADILDAGEDGGKIFVALGWHDGVTLGERLRRDGRIPVKDAVRIAMEIAGALEKAWADTGLWHGHLTADSIHLWPEGHSSLLDLGLSGIRPLWTAGHIDQGLSVLGTHPFYCAPELARGAAVVDYRADIYSLGAILYHMVTGAVPFGNRRAEEVLDQHRMGFLDDPCDLDPNLPHALGWLIESMMARDPARRLSDWSQVMSDLGALDSGGNASRPKLRAGVSVIRRSAQRDPLLAAQLHQTPATRVKAPARAGAKKIRLSPHMPRRRSVKTKSGIGGLIRILSIAIVIGGLGTYAFRQHGHKLPEIALPSSMIAIRLDRDEPSDADTRIDPETGDIKMLPAWNEVARATTTNVAALKPRTTRTTTPTTASPAPARKDELVGDARFVRAADLFNEGLTRFKKFEESRNAAYLDEIPAMSEQAARLFEQCERDFPKDRRLKRHIDESYGLARYARQAMLTAGRDFKGPAKR